MELFEYTKRFPRQNLEYLKYRSFFTRAAFNFGRLKKDKSHSLLSLSSQLDSSTGFTQLPQLSAQTDLIAKSSKDDKENQSPYRDTQSAPKITGQKLSYGTDTGKPSMSQSAETHKRRDNQLRPPTPPYRINQTTMYRTISASRHHRNCVPKKHEQKSTRNTFGETSYIPPLPQTAGGRSIGFDFCQEGHCIFPMATRRHFRSRGRLTCDFCESYDNIDWYCKNCNKNFCTLCKHTHEMSRGSFTSYRDLMDRVFYQKTTLRHLAWRINDIKYQYENDMREKMEVPKKKK